MILLVYDRRALEYLLFLKNFIYMITTIVIVLLVLWLTGFIGFHIAGGIIHILIVIAIVLLVIQLITGE